jgi:hypothetical protein
MLLMPWDIVVRCGHRNNQTIKDSTMKHHTETLLDYLTVLAIGVGLAACLFYGWSA